ncbi:MAG: hypothetical protein JJU25_06570 [Halomonas sp.]|nr:hypothetical protein [Halomonas sp.]MCC5882288.1 hypothetical protein [Halomonas sp.]
MMSKEFLKKLGIVGITFGLSASPLVMAGYHDEEQEGQDTFPEETAPETSGQAPVIDGIEYENEEEEWETADDEWETEDEEEEWETADDEWETEDEEEEWETDEDDDQDW